MLAWLGTAQLEAVAQRRGIEADRLIGLARGDLDWIVMKALEKDRARRYETAHEVALDIQRYLNGEAVLACPPGRMYLLQKLVRRNRGLFAAGAAVLTTLCLGLSLSTFFFFQERAARQEADRERKMEKAFRATAEAMQTIEKAALELEAGKFAEAAALVRTIPASTALTPSLQTAEVERDIGAWYAMHEQWKEAAVFFKGLFQVNQSGRNYGSHAAIWDLLGEGAGLLGSGDRRDAAAYEPMRQQAIVRLGSTQDPLVAERLLRGSLMMAPTNQETLQSLRLPYEVVLKSLSDGASETNISRSEGPWRWVALASLEYRQGRWATAVQRCQSLPLADTNLARIATARLLEAICQQRLGNSAAAQAALKRGGELVEAKFRAGLSNGNLAEGYWFDWVAARILLREATGLIRSAPQALNGPGERRRAGLAMPPSLVQAGGLTGALEDFLGDGAGTQGAVAQDFFYKFPVGGQFGAPGAGGGKVVPVVLEEDLF